MLQATNLTFGRPGGFRLSTQYIDVEHGRILGVLGPNGSGKSTLLQLMSGSLKPKSGAVTWEAKTRRALGPRVWARNIASVPQEAGSIPEMDVQHYVALGLIPNEGLFGSMSSHGLDTVDEALSICNVQDLAQRRLTELSGGQRQRVRIAKALAQAPRVLILDEPGNHLDLHAIAHLADLLHTLTNKGLAIVVSMHDIDLASYLTDDVVVLREGHMEAVGTTAETLTPELIKRCWGVDMITLDDGTRRRYLLKYSP